MMQEDDGCKGIMGWLFGHKFEPRFDESNNDTPAGQWVSQQIPEAILKQAIESEDLADIVEAMSVNSEKTTYVHDVCVRCGKVIYRQGR